jgi:SH3-like domain-containing protein
LPVTIPTGRAFVVTGYGVSFREGPSLEYPVITKLQGRDLLVEIESREEWMHAKTVSDPPQEGWVSSSFVQAMLNEPCQVTGASVNVRESPDMVGRILGRLNQGDVVMKLEERENWWLILKNVTTAGWVSSQYLKPLENEDLYRPRMQVTQNEELANPVQVTRESTETGGERLIFTTPGERFARNGMTKLLVLHRNQQEFAQSASQYKGESILARNQFESALQMTEAGLPQNLAAMYVGAEVLTLLGNRTPGGWQYEITAPTLRTAHFAFIAQSGAQRGEVVVVKANP